jgi:micrococcal nuclease
MVKKIGGLIAITAAAVGGFLSLSFNGNKPINVPAYKAIRVIDGDTFVTAENQNIRLAGIDAPELGLCGSEQAKEELEKLILNQDLYLKVIYHDSSRQIAYVYNKDGLIDEKLAGSGWVEIHGLSGLSLKEKAKLILNNQQARLARRGVYSQLCSQKTNPKNSRCVIKGNVESRGKKYHFPGCNLYNKVEVKLYHGDQWFCTEADAQKAGFTKAGRCPTLRGESSQ